jgi:hypothetical protein
LFGDAFGPEFQVIVDETDEPSQIVLKIMSRI